MYAIIHTTWDYHTVRYWYMMSYENYYTDTYQHVSQYYYHMAYGSTLILIIPGY